MKKEKRYVTRIIRVWNGYHWGIWDKVACAWYSEYFGREDALRVADKLNQKV